MKGKDSRYKIQDTRFQLASCLLLLASLLLSTFNEITCSATYSIISRSGAIAHTCLISPDVKGDIDLEKRVEDMEKHYLIET